MVTRETVVDVKKLFIIFLFYIVFNINPCLSILCGNEQCQEIIAVARTVSNYASRGSGTLSFKSNILVDIYGKAAGKNKDLYLVKIGDKLGYAPQNLLQETRTLKKKFIEVPFKLPGESAETEELGNERSVPQELPQKPTTVPNLETNSNSSSDSQQSSTDKTEAQPSLLNLEPKVEPTVPDSEDHNNNLIKDASADNGNFTVDDLNQYSVDHVHMTSENHDGKVEQQTSDELSGQNENIHLDHQKLNLHSPTEAERSEVHPSSTSSPPDHINFQSNHEHKSENVDTSGNSISIQPSLVNQSPQPTLERCKSSVVFEGTTLCEEYYDSTVPSESFVNEASAQSVFVHTSTQLYPSTESTTPVETSVNSPELPSSNTHIVGYDAPSFVSSVDSQSLSSSSLENLESATETLQPSQPADVLPSQNSVLHSESVADFSVDFNKADTTDMKHEESTEDSVPTDEPSTLSKLTNYVKNVLIGNELSENKDATADVGDDDEEEDQNGNEDEGDEEDQNKSEEEEDEGEIDETDNTETVYFPGKKANSGDDTVVVNNVPTNIREENVLDKKGNIAEENSNPGSIQSSELNTNFALNSKTKIERNEVEISSSGDAKVLAETTNIPQSSSTSKEEPAEVTDDNSLTTEEQVTESSTKSKQNTVTPEASVDSSTGKSSDVIETKVLSDTTSNPHESSTTEEESDTVISTDSLILDEQVTEASTKNEQNAIPEVKSEASVHSIAVGDNPMNKIASNAEMMVNSGSLSGGSEMDESSSSLEKVYNKENEVSSEDHNMQKSLSEDASLQKATSKSDVTDSEKSIAELNDHHSEKMQNGDRKDESEDSELLTSQNTYQTLPSEIMNDSINKSSLDDSDTKRETIVSSSHVESAQIASENKASTHEMEPAFENNDSTSPGEDSSKVPVQSKNNIEKSATAEVGSSQNSVNSNSLTSSNDASDTNISSIELETASEIEKEKPTMKFFEDRFSTDENAVEITVHEGSQDENRFNKINEDSLKVPKISVPEEHGDSPTSESFSHKFDLYGRPTNSEIHADTSENNIDTDANTKPTLDDDDTLSLPLNDDEINDGLTVANTESTRSILSYNEKNSESDHAENRLRDEMSEGIVGAFTEYIGLLPVYLQIIIDLLPLQVQDQLHEWEKNGLSPRVTVVTWITAAFTSLVCICTVLIQRRSKEQMLIGKLGTIEQKMFTVSTERDVLKDELNSMKHQAIQIQKNLLDQQNLSIPLQQELEELKSENRELMNNVETATYQVEMLQSKLVSLQKIADTTDQMNKDFMEKLTENEKILSEMEQNLQKTSAELSEEREQNEELKLSKEQLVNQVYQLESTCNQLLQEAEVWNQRVSELTSLLEREEQECEELKNTVKLKETETKGLENTILKIKIVDESIGLSDEERNENLKNLMDASMLREQLREVQEEKASLQEELKSVNKATQEKEGQLLEAKDEIEKLKLNYNQALQDKMEAQTKLEVLANSYPFYRVPFLGTVNQC